MYEYHFIGGNIMFYFFQSIADFLEDVGAANVLGGFGILLVMYLGFCVW